jgi:hypothetical protein
MKIHGTQSVEVVIDPIQVIDKLLGDIYTTTDGKLMSGDGSRYDTEMSCSSMEELEYYQSLEKVKDYLKKQKR